MIIKMFSKEIKNIWNKLDALELIEEADNMYHLRLEKVILEKLENKDSTEKSEEIFAEYNLDKTFKQGEQAKEKEINERIDNLIKNIEKSKTKTLRKTSVIKQLEGLKY